MQWNALLAVQMDSNPFMRHEYLAALHQSGAAIPQTGWTPRFVTLWRDTHLVAACPLYIKAHSYGEYVFDWAWANAYQQHGLSYYPKAVVAVPFTPVPGPRLLARNPADRKALIQALISWCADQKLSSMHLLFINDDDIEATTSADLMPRHTVQFHWRNAYPAVDDEVSVLPPGKANFSGGGQSLPESSEAKNCHSSDRKFTGFDEFLASLSQEKRKKIRQERRKVEDAGVSFRWSLGSNINPADWDFFYRCYERTYLEHGNAPYLSRDFFQRMADSMPENWLLFVAEQKGTPIATSLIALRSGSMWANGQNDSKVAYGRYWGALQRVDCLHFEACYYQPLQWCIEHGYARFEGGAQGEHKMARALMPVKTSSAHWLAHPAFSDAVGNFLEREGQGINNYMGDLSQRSPFRQI